MFVRWYYLLLALKPTVFSFPPSLPKSWIISDDVNFDMLRKLYLWGMLLCSFWMHKIVCCLIDSSVLIRTARTCWWWKFCLLAKWTCAGCTRRDSVLQNVSCPECTLVKWILYRILAQPISAIVNNHWSVRCRAVLQNLSVQRNYCLHVTKMGKGRCIQRSEL